VTIRSGRFAENLNIELRLPRAALIDVAQPVARGGTRANRLADMRGRIIENFAQQIVTARPTGTRERTLLVDPLSVAVITVSEHDLLRLRETLAQPNAHRRLRTFIDICLLPDDILALATRPPRGRQKAAWALKRALPLAFFLSRRLIQDSHADEMLRQRIARRLAEREPWSEDWRESQALRMSDRARRIQLLLVDRAFDGAWAPARLRPPRDADDPIEYLRTHVYGAASKRVVSALPFLKSHDPGLEQFLTALAEMLLLGAPGAASRLYRLTSAQHRS
jgi:hypothetical protein